MEFKARAIDPVKQRCGCLVVGVYDGGRLSPSAAAVDTAAGGRLARALKRGRLAPGAGRTLALDGLDGVAAECVLLVGCGKPDAFDDEAFRKAAGAAADAVRGLRLRDAVLHLAELEVGERNLYWRVRQLVDVWASSAYRYTGLKSETGPKPLLRRVTVAVPADGKAADARRGVTHAVAVAAGVDTARELGDMPANLCTPSYLARRAGQIARDSAIHVSVLDEARMKRLGMGALLSVARGTREPAKLIVLEYRGAPKKQRPVVLVGKGVTFDSGGISIKPSAAMDEMKFDMCGAASVLGTVQAAAALGLRENVVALVPATENLPDGSATKPGDVVKTMSGLSVEILNTDAEGRLILCDAITYARRFRPELVIDVATLTGACVVALGAQASGLFANDDDLAEALLAAGEDSGDRCWRLPLWPAYRKQLDSNFADMANVGGRGAGAVTAACFLGRFAEDMPWAHLDIAGTAWRTGRRKGATGRPVRLLCEYLLQRAGEATTG